MDFKEIKYNISKTAAAISSLMSKHKDTGTPSETQRNTREFEHMKAEQIVTAEAINPRSMSNDTAYNDTPVSGLPTKTGKGNIGR